MRSGSRTEEPHGRPRRKHRVYGAAGALSREEWYTRTRVRVRLLQDFQAASTAAWLARSRCLKAGARIDLITTTSNRADFVLWKQRSLRKNGWAFGFGRGRPAGISSARQALRLLGKPPIVSLRRRRLIFPHHETNRPSEDATNTRLRGSGFTSSILIHRRRRCQVVGNASPADIVSKGTGLRAALS